MICELDGREMTTREALHAHLAQQLSLPEWYGKNLDALYDALTEMNGRVIVLHHISCMLNSLGEYARMTLNTMIDAVQANSSLEIRIRE